MFSPARLLPVISTLILSGILQRPVFAAGSTTALTLSSASPALSAPVTLTATVTPGTATGFVTFSDGGGFVGRAAISNGIASFTTKALPAGSRVLRAYYTGDSSLTASASSAVNVTVKALGTNGIRGAAEFSAAAATTSAFGLSAATADFNGDGAIDLVVTTDGGVSLLAGGTPPGTLKPPVAISAPVGTAWGVVAADFNGDGKTDLAIGGSLGGGVPTSSTIAVLLGNGDGTFRLIGTYTASVAPAPVRAALVAADFNGDGKIDLAALGGGSTNLALFAGHGDGSFGAAAGQSYGNKLTYAVVTDVNGDGKPDIVGGDDFTAGIYINKGDGTFLASTLSVYYITAQSVAAADFDGDGKIDLATAGLSGVNVFKGNGDGTFQTPTLLLATTTDTSIVVCDLDGDGKLDLATATNSIGYPGLNVFYGKGDGTFLRVTNYGLTRSTGALVVADLNGDGRTDLAVMTASGTGQLFGAAYVDIYSGIAAGPADASVSLVSSAPAAILGQPVTLTATLTPPSATGLVTFYEDTTVLGTAAIINGAATLVSRTLTTGVHSLTARYLGDNNLRSSLSAKVQQTTNSRPTAKLLLAGLVSMVGAGPNSAAVADFNGDGKLDLVMANSGVARGTSVAMGLGNGVFLAPAITLDQYGFVGIAAGDFNLDGKADYAAGGVSGVSFFYGKGDGTFSAPSTVNLANALSLTQGDFNGDGRPDLASGSVRLQNNGDGTFQPPAYLGTFGTPLVVGDWNGDGILDLAAQGIYAGVGTGGFQVAAGPDFFAVGAEDFNQDGRLDLLTIGSVLKVYLGNGDGTFPTSSSANLAVGGDPLAGDFDGDGKPDIVTPGMDPNYFDLYKGNGDGTFQAAVRFSSSLGGYSGRMLTADVNGDGRLDVLVAAGYGVVVMLGAPAGVEASTVTVAASPTPAFVGKTATFTATVTPSTATGSVAFYDGAIALGSAPLSAGTATLATTNLSVAGGRTIVAVYSGDGANGLSFSAGLALQVNAGTPPVVAPATLPDAYVGQAYRYRFQASGGTPPYLYGYQPSDLFLTGMYVNTLGEIYGVPTQAGTFTFTFFAEDHAGLQGAQTFQLVVRPASAAPSAVSVVSLSPAAAAGAGQSFTFQFSHTSGASALAVVNVLINTALDGRSACYIAYSVPTGTLYLVSDTGNATYAGTLPIAAGQGFLGNSQCGITGFGSSATTNGNILTLTLNLNFVSSFAGNRVIYLAARDNNGANTGWQTAGVYGVSPLPDAFPRPVSTSPSSGSGANGTFTFVYQDAASANNLQTAWALINTAIDGRGACYVAYYKPANAVYLVPDNGDGSQAASMVLSGTNTLSNGQCTVSAQGSSAVVNGPQLVLNLNISFQSAFGGRKGVWQAVQTLSGDTSPWQALGVWQVP